MKKYFYLLVLLFSQQLFAQKVMYSGTVVNKNNEPLEAVTVNVKGAKLTAITNQEGKFTISVPTDHPVFIFSHIGYKTTEVTGNSLVLQIIMEENTVTIKGVTVSTGYQELSQSTSTGSYEKMNNELLNYKTGSNVLSRMDGLLPSVLFDKRNNAANDIKIRGISTLGYASTAPWLW